MKRRVPVRGREERWPAGGVGAGVSAVPAEGPDHPRLRVRGEVLAVLLHVYAIYRQ